MKLCLILWAVALLYVAWLVTGEDKTKDSPDWDDEGGFR